MAKAQARAADEEGDGSAHAGILPVQAIRGLIEAGQVKLAQPPLANQLQPASLDLRLGGQAFRVRASFLPGADTVAAKLRDLHLHTIDLSKSAVLETGCVYIVPLLESMALPPELAAATNPKSSTGRLDVFTRVIADGVTAFDQVPAGYHGPLYAEICPQTFPIVVRTGSRLSQIRFRAGPTQDDDLALVELHSREKLVSADQADIADGIALSVDLIGDNGGLVGYRAKRHTGVVDVDAPGACAVLDFWEPIEPARIQAADSRSRPVLHSCLEGGGARAARRMRPRWCRSIRWSASSACITPASSIRASAMQRPAAPAPRPCSRCAATRCRSSWRMARSSAASSTSG